MHFFWIFFFFLSYFQAFTAQDINTLNSKKNLYLDASWVKTGELITHKKNKKVFSATSYEGASIQIAHQLEAGWNPLAFRVGLEYPLKGRLIYKYKKNQTLRRIKKEFNLNMILCFLRKYIYSEI